MLERTFPVPLSDPIPVQRCIHLSKPDPFDKFPNEGKYYLLPFGLLVELCDNCVADFILRLGKNTLVVVPVRPLNAAYYGPMSSVVERVVGQ